MPEKNARFLAGVVAVIVAADCVWSWSIGFRLTELSGTVIRIGGLAVIAALYFRYRPNDRLVEMASYVVLWLVFSIAAAALTYDAAAMALPLQDSLFRNADHALAFDLGFCARILQNHRWLYYLLQLDYGSLIIQISFTVLLVAHLRVAGRNAELLACSIISLLICGIVSGVLPAIGPTQAENPLLSGPPDYLGDILAMRSGLPVSRDLAHLQGIVCFPSYHTVLALLLIRAHRGLPTFKLIACINVLMLMSVPPIGNHYLVDMLGGGVVTAMSIFAAKYVLAGLGGPGPSRHPALSHPAAQA